MAVSKDRYLTTLLVLVIVLIVIITLWFLELLGTVLGLFAGAYSVR